MQRSTWAGKVGLWFAVLLVTGTTLAQPIDRRSIPPDLAEWTEWVLDELGEEACPAIAGKAMCWWPGELSVSVEPRGGDFRYVIYADRPTSAQLPGTHELWPQDVQLGTRPAVVDDRDGVPVVRVDAGRNVISGKFLWDTPPDSLTIPERCGLVSLEANGKTVRFPRREKSTLWFEGIESEVPRPAEGTTTPGDERPDSIDLEVTRQIVDGTPLVVSTQLQLRVGGKPREEVFGRVQLTGSQLLGVQSDSLPVRVEDETLAVQVRPGTFTVRLVSAFATPPERLVAPRLPEPWPRREFWSWRPDEALRQVEISGAGSIDASRTTLPQDWRTGRAYQLLPGNELTMATRRRGQTEPPPNELRLEREMWLALDGQQWTVRDTLTGSMSRDFRLDLREGQLGRVASPDQDFLLTHDPGSGTAGVEVRQGSLRLFAEWVLGSRTNLPAVGWSEDVRSLKLVLHTPPGWEVVSVRGVDNFQSGLFRRLGLTTLIAIVLLALAVGKLGMPWWGVLTGVALILATRTLAPEPPSLTPWFVVVAAVAGLRYVPWRGLRPVLWGGAVVGTLALGARLASYNVDLIVSALAPQGARSMIAEAELEEKEPELILEEDADNKEGGTGTRAKGEEGSMGRASSGATNKRYAIQGPKDAAGYGGGRYPHPRADEEEADRTAPHPPPPADVVLQMGPGVPTYEFRSWELPLDGPVRRDHRIQLVMISPLVNAILGMLQSGLLLAAFALLLRLLYRAGDSTPGRRNPASAVVAVGAAALCIVWPGVARAQVPTQELLEDLKARLIRNDDCGSCVSVSRMTLELDGPTINTQAEVHVTGIRGYELPGPTDVWTPTQVTVDGQPTSALALQGDTLFVRLPPGKHVVKASGDVTRANLTFSLGTSPRHVDVQTNGWSVEGLGPNGVPSCALNLTRTVQATETEDAEQRPPSAGDATVGAGSWLRISRTLQIDNQWTVATRVERVGPGRGAISIEYPLLTGERITDPSVISRGGKALLSLDKGQSERVIPSTLKVRPNLEMTALKGARASEVWSLACSEIWRCSYAGLTPVTLTQGGMLRPRFAPWPGEKVQLHLVRPEPTPGASLTIDRVNYKVSPGPRSLEAQLSVAARTSKAQPLIVTLPDGSELTEFRFNDDEEPIQRSGREITANLEPGGTVVTVRWKQAIPLGLYFRTPEVRLSAPAANVEVNLEPRGDRVFLWVGGRAWGPRTMIWFDWLILLAFAVVLGTLPNSPLPIWQWAVLGFGFVGEAPWGVLGTLCVWFLLFQARGRVPLAQDLWHNLRQVGLAVVTLIAAVMLGAGVYSRLSEEPRWIVGGGYSRYGFPTLTWYRDAVDGSLPRPYLVSAPGSVAMALYVVWAAAVAYLCWRWGRWAWQQYGEGGYWRGPLVPSWLDRQLGTDPKAASPMTTPPREVPPDDALDATTTTEEPLEPTSAEASRNRSSNSPVSSGEGLEGDDTTPDDDGVDSE